MTNRCCGAIALLSLLAGCGGLDEPIDLLFPSGHTFVRVETAQIFVVDIGPDEVGNCPELLSQAELGALMNTEQSTEARPVCEFDRGLVNLPDVAEGLKAYVAVARAASGTVYLSGCAIADVYADEPLVVTLTPTQAYRVAFPAGTAPPSCTRELKCAGGC